MGQAKLELTPAQLARLLGNIPNGEAEDESPDRQQCQVKAPKASTSAAGRLSSKEDSAAARCALTGPELLEAIGGQDSLRALRAVKLADTVAVNYSDEIERNALLLAVMEGHTGVCRTLLARPDFAGVNARTNVGATALHLAAGNDEVEICRMLLACPRYTTSVNAADDRGRSPLDFALDFSNGDAAAVLRAAGGERMGGGPRRRWSGTGPLIDPAEALEAEDGSAQTVEAEDAVAMNSLD